MRQWSFSSLSTYEQCALKYWFEKMSEEPRPPSGRAAARGTRVHEQAEAYLLGNRADAPKEFSNFNDELTALIDNEAVAEMDMAFDEHWVQTDWDSSWVRGKLDAVVPDRGIVVDFKTGRYYPKHREQAELYALMSYKMGFVEDQMVTVEFWYLDLDDLTTWEWNVDRMEKIEARWLKRAQKLDAEEAWEPTANQFCKWCGYRDKCPIGGEVE